MISIIKMFRHSEDFRKFPEEINLGIEFEPDDENGVSEDNVCVLETQLHHGNMLDNLLDDIISNIKNRDDFFSEFIDLLKRNFEKRYIIMEILKRNTEKLFHGTYNIN